MDHRLRRLQFNICTGSMPSYGQFCPVAKAMEILDERWTMLVIRELLEGSTQFNDLRRGVPKMSPALLSKRLKTLERMGLAQERRPGVWQLDAELDTKLRRLGERADKIKMMQRSIHRLGAELPVQIRLDDRHVSEDFLGARKEGKRAGG